MNQSDRRKYLIEELLKESPRYRDMQMPGDENEQKKLLRSLMNVRPPRPVSGEFLKIQDEYLSEEAAVKGVTDSDALKPCPADERIFIWQGDITSLKVDAIVNAANSALRGCFIPCHSCIDNIIHSMSGIQLRLACDEIMKAQGHEEPTGTAKITPAFNLPSKFVIHTVGPIVSGNFTQKHCDKLKSCYESCLELAAENGIKSIAFCCISTGEFHFPNDEAAKIAVDTVKKFLERDESIEKVIFNVFKDLDRDIYEKLLEE